LARLEGEVVLKALAERVQSIEIIGEPTRRYNNTLRGLMHLPVRLVQ
jgi:4-methoxybenzoate monooxygenase (O-demethylating)